jgi:hypothetical protein
MDLSVVIRCGDDERVFDCIQSIDEDVEIVVSTSENPLFQSKLESKGIKYCLSPRRNLSKVSNIGVENATYEKVIITDSDTIFEKGCIREMYLALDDYDVVRAKLKFLTSKDKSFSTTVAEARDYVNSLPLVYTPGVGVKKSITGKIGGFLFNDPVPYAVDADLDYRIKNANIPVKYLTNATLYHDVESIRHDMKAAYRIGSGCMTSAIYLSKQIHNNELTPKTIVRKLKAVKKSHMGDVARQKGVGVFIYQIMWNFLFNLGKNWRWITRHKLIVNGGVEHVK